MTHFRAGFPAVLLVLGLLLTYAPVARAELCPDAQEQLRQTKQNASGDTWVAVAEAFRSCKQLKPGASDDVKNEIYAQVINAYRSATKAFRQELSTVRDHSEITGKLNNAEQQLKRCQEDLVNESRKVTQLVEAKAACEKLVAPKCAEVTPAVVVPGYERLSLRIETGYSAGRLSRSESQTTASHSGGFVQLSPMARFPYQRVAVLFGPYYSYWRAIDRTTDIRLDDARAHSFGGKLELGVALGPKIKHWLSLHPSFEVGLDYVRFDSNWKSQPDDYYLDPVYLDRTGFVVAGNLNACVWYSAFCLGVRLKSVPGAVSVPTTQVTFGFDPVRVLAAIMSP
jgi:hypothetical protein